MYTKVAVRCKMKLQSVHQSLVNRWIGQWSDMIVLGEEGGLECIRVIRYLTVTNEILYCNNIIVYYPIFENKLYKKSSSQLLLK